MSKRPAFISKARANRIHKLRSWGYTNVGGISNKEMKKIIKEHTENKPLEETIEVNQVPIKDGLTLRQRIEKWIKEMESQDFVSMPDDVCYAEADKIELLKDILKEQDEEDK
jgi:hypothetical protein